MASRRDFVTAASLSTVSLTVPVAAQSRLEIPEQTMSLRRVLKRALYDGSAIQVDREWAVGFRRQRTGTVITGHQLSVRVSAPQALAAMAQVERQRSTQRLFPITLDGAGRIMDAGPCTLRADIALAAQVAGAIWPSNDAVGTDPFASLRQIPQGPPISLVGMGGHLPPDLFFPVNRDERATRTLDFPNGVSGQIELSSRVKSQADRPWLKHWERTITTSIGGTQRRSSENWSLSAF